MPGMPGMDFSQMGFSSGMPGMQQMSDAQQMGLSLPMPNGTKSVSTPLASAVASMNGGLGNMTGPGPLSAPSLNSASSMASSTTLASTPSEDALKGMQMPGAGNVSTPTSSTSGGVPSSISAALAQQTHDQLMAQRYNIPEESWKHHAQARAILSNLIGPNGEQLTSSDPYNTTVFVGGLSPLISEETLRTFFAPFGEIHYVRCTPLSLCVPLIVLSQVKVPVGKHCGFVQFVRKPDAERAIEKMQGFPIGGSRIRLSWGRSQCMFVICALLAMSLTYSRRQSGSGSGAGRSSCCVSGAVPSSSGANAKSAIAYTRTGNAAPREVRHYAVPQQPDSSQQ